MQSCSSTNQQNIERGSDFLYKPGHPNVTVSAFGLMDEDQQPYLMLHARTTFDSLIFREEGDERIAEVELEIRVFSSSDGDSPAFTETKRKKIIEDDISSLSNEDAFLIEQRLDVHPGDYEIHLTVTDLTSGNSATRSLEAFLPDFGTDEFTISNIQLFAKDNNSGLGWQPVTSYHVQSSADSLKFSFQVISHSTDIPLELNSKLVRFESDTMPAAPMYHPNRGTASTTYKGIDYSDKEEILTSRRVLEQYDNTVVEFRIPNQQRGNFRFETTAERTDGDEIFKARDFSILSENFPNLKTARELAAPLIYLMDRRDHEKMMEIDNAEDLKEAVDRFWLSQLQSQQTAKDVLNMYYERVEQANKQFTNFKEGWKTDQGFIYILFGPPWYVEKPGVDRYRWGYGYVRDDPDLNFIFREPRMRTDSFPFHHRILVRNNFYTDTQHRQTSLWLNGLILQRSI